VTAPDQGLYRRYPVYVPVGIGTAAMASMTPSDGVAEYAAQHAIVMSMRLSEVTEAASAAGPNFRIGAHHPKAGNRVEGKGGQEDLDKGEEG
jgi:hypothetical protein